MDPIIYAFITSFAMAFLAISNLTRMAEDAAEDGTPEKSWYDPALFKLIFQRNGWLGLSMSYGLLIASIACDIMFYCFTRVS